MQDITHLFQEDINIEMLGSKVFDFFPDGCDARLIYRVIMNSFKTSIFNFSFK